MCSLWYRAKCIYSATAKLLVQLLKNKVNNTVDVSFLLLYFTRFFIYLLLYLIIASSHCQSEMSQKARPALANELIWWITWGIQSIRSSIDLLVQPIHTVWMIVSPTVAASNVLATFVRRSTSSRFNYISEQNNFSCRQYNNMHLKCYFNLQTRKPPGDI